MFVRNSEAAQKRCVRLRSMERFAVGDGSPNVVETDWDLSLGVLKGTRQPDHGLVKLND